MSGTAETDPPNNDDTKPSEDTKPDDTGPEKSFSQDDVDGMTGKSRNQGRQAALKEVAETLGMSVEEAKKFIDDKKKADRAQLEEHERLKAEAEDLQREAEEKLARAEAATLRANVSTALNENGEDSQPVRGDRRDLAIDMAIRFAGDAPDGEDAAAYGATKVREASPEWFGTSGDPDDDEDGDDGSKGGTPKAKGSPAGKKKAEKTDSATRYAEWKKKRQLRPLSKN